MINFNEAPFSGDELNYIKEAVDSKHISGDGKYTKLCNEILEKRTGTKRSFLTNSCTAALEMSALMLNLEYGDEIICPSFTFVTSASAFALRGAKIVFADIRNDTLNLDENLLEQAITPKTKAIIAVHYAGVSCEMDKFLEIAKKYNLKIIEDAAQALGSSYNDKPCGSIGDFGCFSFHETKNISCGEGGALLVNNENFIEPAEIIREKGTNRSKFFRGQVDKYTWVGLGSSYLLGDMLAAYLYPQLLKCEQINIKRVVLWNNYHKSFEEFEKAGIVKRPFVPANREHNGHTYYLRFNSLDIRTKFINFMKKNEIRCVFHYVPLHSSPAGLKYGRVSGSMDITDNTGGTLVRLPLFYGMDFKAQNEVIEKAILFLRELL